MNPRLMFCISTTAEPIFRYFNDFSRESRVLSIKRDVKYEYLLGRKIHKNIIQYIIFNNKFKSYLVTSYI